MTDTIQARARCGRGATPVTECEVVLDRANRFGRRKLKFRYRALKAWDERHLDAAHQVIRAYFQHVGGFQVATDAVVNRFVHSIGFDDERAADGDLPPGVYTVQEHLWAIDEKAKSLVGETPDETADKRVFVGAPQTWPDRLEPWLLASDAYHRARYARRGLARADSPCLPAPPPRVERDAAPPEPLLSVGAAGTRVLRESEAQRRERLLEQADMRAAPHAGKYRRQLARLSDAQRKRLDRECIRLFDSYVRNSFGAVSPHDVRLDAIRLEYFWQAAMQVWPDVMDDER